MNKLKRLLFFIVLVSGYSSIAQPSAALQKFDSMHQACMYKTNNALICSERYAKQMDSMLQVVYKMARVRLDTTVRKNLNAEQAKWIQERDSYLTIQTHNDEDLDENSRKVDMTEKRANYDRRRLAQLLKRLTY
ncbi:MAG TPA: lysozyme inhibitor LprI family protein [Bacteroidia bacterium]|nr:lysozyme inhibitor LprI family protein [Bacteroidia bacterium]